MNKWQAIEMAPKDGTEILAKNECMDKPVRVRWGVRHHPWGTSSMQWVRENGDLVIPTVWKPVEDVK